ncbi:MAG: trigger factor [Limisphaerales bacterium]
MNIIEEKIDSLNQVVTISISKEDYEVKLEDSLKNLRKTVSLKGFRPGKVPVSLVKKMYGTSVLAEELDKIVRSELTTYLKDNDLNILGAPMPRAEEGLDIDINKLGEFAFTYELGLSPEIDLAAVSDSTKVVNSRIEVDSALVDEEWDRILKQSGELTVAEEIAEGDLLNIKLTETDKKGTVKEGGIVRDSSINHDMVVIEKLAKSMIGKKVGDTILFADLPAALNRDRDAVLKNMLDIKEEDSQIGNSFNAEVLSIKRNTPAAADKELFDKVFGPDNADSEDAAKKLITEQLQNAYDSRTDRKLHDDIVKQLLEATEIELPEEFLRKWLESQKENNESVEDEEFEYFRRNLKWSLIYNKIAREQELAVERTEIDEAVKADIAKYYGGSIEMLGEEESAGLVNKLLQDKEYLERVNSTLLDTKIFGYLKSQLQFEDNLMSKDAYEALLKAESETPE